MMALQLGCQSADALEMRNAYMVQSPRRGTMKFIIGCQSALGLARINYNFQD
jgi:hypothetical protein